MDGLSQSPAAQVLLPLTLGVASASTPGVARGVGGLLQTVSLQQALGEERRRRQQEEAARSSVLQAIGRAREQTVTAPTGPGGPGGVLTQATPPVRTPRFDPNTLGLAEALAPVNLGASAQLFGQATDPGQIVNVDGQLVRVPRSGQTEAIFGQPKPDLRVVDGALIQTERGTGRTRLLFGESPETVQRRKERTEKVKAQRERFEFAVNQGFPVSVARDFASSGDESTLGTGPTPKQQQAAEANRGIVEARQAATEASRELTAVRQGKKPLDPNTVSLIILRLTKVNEAIQIDPSIDEATRVQFVRDNNIAISSLSGLLAQQTQQRVTTPQPLAAPQPSAQPTETAANAPPKKPTSDQALAEARRLIQLGHSSESAIQAMKKAGWDVEL